MKEKLLKKLLGIVQFHEHDDHLKIQKFFNCIHQEEEDDVDMLEYFFTCMLHPLFYTSFENPSIFITHSKTYEYVMKTCGNYFSNTPSSLLYGMYFGYIQYQYMFHNDSQSDVQFQRKILENLLMMSMLIPHITTRYSKKWLQRFIERGDFIKVFLHFCHDLENYEHYIDVLKKSTYLQDCFKNSLVTLEVFFNYLADTLPTQWLNQMIQQKDMLIKMYKLGYLKSVLSFLLFRTYDYFEDHSLTCDELEKIFNFIENSSGIHDFHVDHLEQILKKKQKNKKNKKKKKNTTNSHESTDSKEDLVVLDLKEESTDSKEDLVVVDVKKESTESLSSIDVTPDVKDITYYYDESNEFIDLYNTLSCLEL